MVYRGRGQVVDDPVHPVLVVDGFHEGLGLELGQLLAAHNLARLQ